ncbi:uncharacterized protein [Antedon mediterranea]|uniref:uncharacterized protein n=1 Tax=Antedon mediterranea TaxID=105859 RepID=UPI003AF91DA8
MGRSHSKKRRQQKRLTEWQTRIGKRREGRQTRRWRGDIISYTGTTCRTAQNRKKCGKGLRRATYDRGSDVAKPRAYGVPKQCPEEQAIEYAEKKAKKLESSSVEGPLWVQAKPGGLMPLRYATGTVDDRAEMVDED